MLNKSIGFKLNEFLHIFGFQKIVYKYHIYLINQLINNKICIRHFLIILEKKSISCAISYSTTHFPAFSFCFLFVSHSHYYNIFVIVKCIEVIRASTIEKLKLMD